MKRTLAAILALLLLPLPVNADHEDVEAGIFEEYIARLSDTTQNPSETIIIGHETTWACAVRQLYFDLMIYAQRFWPTAPAQSAAAAARGLADVQGDFCTT